MMFGGLMGLPLIILIPVLLVTLGVGIYLVVTLLPFIVAGAVFIFAFYVARWLKIPEPWNILVPVGAALIAIMPHFVKSFTAGTMSLASALSGEAVPSYTLTPFAIIAIVLFLALMAAGTYSFVRRGEWSALGVSLAAIALMLTIVPGMVRADLGSAVVAVDGHNLSSSIWAGQVTLVSVLLVSIAIIYIIHRWRLLAR